MWDTIRKGGLLTIVSQTSAHGDDLDQPAAPPSPSPLPCYNALVSQTQLGSCALSNALDARQDASANLLHTILLHMSALDKGRRAHASVLAVDKGCRAHKCVLAVDKGCRAHKFVLAVDKGCRAHKFVLAVDKGCRAHELCFGSCQRLQSTRVCFGS